MARLPSPTVGRSTRASVTALGVPHKVPNMDDWPHDPDGEEGSEGRRQYGHAIIAKKVDEEADFPLDVDAFVEEYGDDPIRLDHETVVPLREIFQHVEESSYEDIVAMHKGVGRAMRRAGLWFYEGADEFVDTESAP
jgi:hypothetical protein